MRLKLKIDTTGAVTTAPANLAPGAYASRGFSVVTVCHIPHGTPPAEVVATYTRRIVNIHPYGPFQLNWSHLVKLSRAPSAP